MTGQVDQPVRRNATSAVPATSKNARSRRSAGVLEGDGPPDDPFEARRARSERTQTSFRRKRRAPAAGRPWLAVPRPLQSLARRPIDSVVHEALAEVVPTNETNVGAADILGAPEAALASRLRACRRPRNRRKAAAPKRCGRYPGLPLTRLAPCFPSRACASRAFQLCRACALGAAALDGAFLLKGGLSPTTRTATALVAIRPRTATAPTATASTAAPGRTVEAPRLSLARHVYGDGSPVELRAVQILDGLLRLLVGFELDEPEAPGLASHSIGNNRDGAELTEFREGLAKLFFARRVAEIADVQFAVH